jgi:hypothetical protein
MHKDIGHALAALGATGKVTVAGGYYTGPFSPDTPWLRDPVVDKSGKLLPDSTGAWRWLGTAPHSMDDMTAVSRVGRGESTTLSLVADVVQHATNPLGIDPTAIPAVLADLAKFNGGLAYYDLNYTVIGDQLSIDYVVGLHDQLFPRFAQDGADAATAAGEAHQRAAWLWWSRNQDATEGQAGVAPDQHECRLRGYRNAVSGLVHTTDGVVSHLSWTAHTGPPNPAGLAPNLWGVGWLEPDVPIVAVRIDADGSNPTSATLGGATSVLVLLDRVSGQSKVMR